MVAARRSIDEMFARPQEQWSLLPHATILWFLQPNTVFIFQQDHAQLYQARPGRTADEAMLDISLYVPHDSELSERHWQRNFELLVDVTDQEDFSIAAGIQWGFGTAAQQEIVFGRNEPALQHYHAELDSLLRD